MSSHTSTLDLNEIGENQLELRRNSLKIIINPCETTAIAKTLFGSKPDVPNLKKN